MSLINKPAILKQNCFRITPVCKKHIEDFNTNSTGNIPNQPRYREDLIYESKEGDFFNEEYHSITLINILNTETNTSRTIAKYVTKVDKVTVQKTSDEIAKLIGQNAYNNLFHSVCSVINQEARIRGILSLLTVPVLTDPTKCTQTVPVEVRMPSLKINMESQTNETQLAPIKKGGKRIMTPSVGPLKKGVIDPVASNSKALESEKEHNEFQNESQSNETQLAPIKKRGKWGLTPFVVPLKKGVIDPISSNSKALEIEKEHTEIETSTDLINKSLLVEKYKKIKPIILKTTFDKNNKPIKVPFKLEDVVRISMSKQNWEAMSIIERRKILNNQMQIDRKNRMSMKDKDGKL